MRCVSMLIVGILLQAALVSAAPPPAPRASLGDAKADFDKGEYRPCLQKIAGALNGPEGKIGSSSRYDLLVLRGECMLHLKERRLATEAFRSASDVAKSKQDRTRMADALAVTLLLESSKGPMAYAPTASPDKPIDFVDPASRKQAEAALYADKLAASRPKLEAAVQADSLAPILEQLPVLRNLYILELASTGEVAQTLPLARSIGQQARALMGTELGKINDRIDFLGAASAAPVIVGDAVGASVIVPTGLNTPEREELQGIADQLVKIERVAQQGRWIARQTDGPVEEWERLLADCSDVKTKAQQLWDRRY